VPRPDDVLILASASPRRRELLDALGLGLAVVPAAVDEEAIAGDRPPGEAARAVACAKGRAAAARCDDMVVLAADTIVVAGGARLGKPADDDGARRMLGMLRGGLHEVLTGVWVRAPSGERSALVRTAVHMRCWSDHEQDAYVAGGAPLDKAGGYGIQDEPFRPVASVDGCWCNVVGLPLWTAARLIAWAGISVPRSPEQAFGRCGACPLRDQESGEPSAGDAARRRG
jgi:septum formation protein